MNGLSAIDVTALLAAMLVVTIIGRALAGRVNTRRDFFEAGGSLPWWAVSSSIIATVVSSVTFISVPAAVFRDGGNLGYIQVLLGLMFGKLLTAWVFTRPYYLSSGVRTTYDYIGARVHPRVGRFSLGLGMALSVVNTAVKVLTTGLVLSVVTDWSLAVCVFWVVLFAILWSAIAGLKTVIWTDFLLFVIFTGGAVFSISWTSGQLEMSFGEAFARLDEAAKLTLFDLSLDPGKTYTLWAGLIGGSLLSLAMAGSQGTMQRIRACRSPEDARKAYVLSALFYLTPICMLGVGLVLTLFYQEHPMSSELTASLVSEPDRIFPYFIATEIPTGFSAIFIGAIFAAGISTLDTSLTEMADITITNIYEPRTPGRSEAHYLLASRLSLFGWGALYGGVALFFSRFSAEGLLDLTFKLPNYLNGALLGTILLARLGIGDVRTYVSGFVAAAVTVAWMSYSGVGFFWWCPGSALVMIVVVAGIQRKPIEPSGLAL